MVKARKLKRRLKPGTPMSPTSAEVEAHIKRVAKKHPKRVKVKRVGSSGEGRPIWAVTVNDRSVPSADKQHALFTGGRHGNEEAGRFLSLALLDWLVTKAGRQTLRHQKIVIMPNCNPDACEIDIHWTPGRINVGVDMFEPDAIPESAAMRTVFDALQPELWCDMHARGHCGCSYDMVMWCATRNWNEDDNLFHEIARDVGRAGEAAGMPHRLHPLAWWTDPAEGVWDQVYRAYKSICILTETSEQNDVAYPLAVRVRTGLARVKALLEWGNRRYPQLYYPGYPVDPVGGMFTEGAVALGRTAAQRRKSRVAIWHNMPCFRKLANDIPEQAKRKIVRFEWAGPTLKTGIGILTRARGKMKVKAVRLNGKKLRPSETRGYYTWHDVCSTFVVTCIPELRRGKRVIEILFA